jgi:dienelactone hydrolase
MILKRVQPAADGHFLHFNDQFDRPCAVWCRLGVPAGPGPWPAVIHCPGGGQAPDAADIAFWNAHGFACVAFDWQHGLYPGHDPARKSQWPPGVIAQGAGSQERPQDPRQLIFPVAVRAIGVIIDWLEGDQRIDAERIGITGISWGGYLTWVANAHEPRLRAAVPVYGCGGLFDPVHACTPIGLVPAVRQAWLADWEPSRLAARQRHPVCHLSGSNDFFGWPRHGDMLLDAVTVPCRRSWAPNLDHALESGQSALAVAWMDRWLRSGPALPPEPQPGDPGEPWWTCSTGRDDRSCWWPGSAPAWATARLVRVRHGALTLSSRIERLRPSARPPALPARWPDIRAGIGWNWDLSSTQLHSNAGVGIIPLAGDASRGVVTGNRAGPLGLILRQTADPRWTGRGFAGLRLRLTGLTRRPDDLTVTFCGQQAIGRPEPQMQLPLAADGWLCIDRLPVGLAWNEVTRLNVNGIPGPSFTLGPIERLPNR